jgi:hypothetical protein
MVSFVFVFVNTQKKKKTLICFELCIVHLLFLVLFLFFSGQVFFPSSLGVCYTPHLVRLRFFLSSVLYLFLHIGDNV